MRREEPDREEITWTTPERQYKKDWPEWIKYPLVIGSAILFILAMRFVAGGESIRPFKLSSSGYVQLAQSGDYVATTYGGTGASGPTVSGQYLKSTGLGTTGWFDSGGQYKVFTSTKDLTDDSGTTSYTSCGWTPSAILANATPSASGSGESNGFTDGLNEYSVYACTNATTRGHETGGFIMGCATFGSAFQLGAIISMDALGFTVMWNKTGSPTGNLLIDFMCIR